MRAPPPLYRKAFLAELEEYHRSDDFQQLCAKFGLDPTRVSARAVHEFNQITTEERIRELSPQPKAPRLTWWERTLLALFALAPAGERGIPTGELYELLAAAGFDMKKSSKVRSQYMNEILDILVNKGLAIKLKNDAGTRNLAVITARGREFALAYPVVNEEFQKARERLRRRDGGPVEGYVQG